LGSDIGDTVGIGKSGSTIFIGSATWFGTVVTSKDGFWTGTSWATFSLNANLVSLATRVARVSVLNWGTRSRGSLGIETWTAVAVSFLAFSVGRTLDANAKGVRVGAVVSAPVREALAVGISVGVCSAYSMTIWPPAAHISIDFPAIGNEASNSTPAFFADANSPGSQGVNTFPVDFVRASKVGTTSRDSRSLVNHASRTFVCDGAGVPTRTLDSVASAGGWIRDTLKGGRVRVGYVRTIAEAVSGFVQFSIIWTYWYAIGKVCVPLGSFGTDTGFTGCVGHSAERVSGAAVGVVGSATFRYGFITLHYDNGGSRVTERGVPFVTETGVNDFIIFRSSNISANRICWASFWITRIARLDALVLCNGQCNKS
jgi:hypothetical protein